MRSPASIRIQFVGITTVTQNAVTSSNPISTEIGVSVGSAGASIIVSDPADGTEILNEDIVVTSQSNVDFNMLELGYSYISGSNLAIAANNGRSSVSDVTQYGFDYVINATNDVPAGSNRVSVTGSFSRSVSIPSNTFASGSTYSIRTFATDGTSTTFGPVTVITIP